MRQVPAGHPSQTVGEVVEHLVGCRAVHAAEDQTAVDPPDGDDVVVGYRVPRRATLYALPRDSGITTMYRYTVINNRAVLVDPNTREIVEILN